LKQSPAGDKDDWLGKPFEPLVCSEDQSAATDLARRALLGENLPLFELRLRSKAGAPVILEFTVTPQMKEGKVVGLFGVGRDITERKRTEAALRASEERFHAFMDNSPMAAYIKDAQGRYTYVNRLFELSFKVKQTEILGKTAFNFYPATVAEQFQKNDSAVLASDQPMETACTLKTPDGKVREALFLRFSIRGISGERFLGAVVVDITERKRLEEQCRQSQKMEAVGQLAGGVAHDFNNILTAILGYSEMLAAELTAKNPLHHLALEVKKAAQRAGALTRQLLAFSRKQALQPRIINLNDVVTDIDKMLRRVIGETIDLVAVRSAALGLVKADPSQIEQVIMNLVVNARDAMPQGGKLTIETANVSLEQDLLCHEEQLPPGEYVMLSVTDTGTGMAREVMGHLFEPFFTTKESGKGTGLGLATCYGIVKQSGGCISAYSEPDRGSTFKVYLPRVRELNLAADPGHEKPVELPGGTETILFAEDEAAVQEVTANALAKLGYNVLKASDGAEAMHLVEQHGEDEIQLLLSDTVMPRMGGKELAERFKAARPRAKVLFTSGYPADVLAPDGILAPGIAFLQKPYPVVALARKIREVLDG
jgi:PAS domain S-box-containing protein